MPHQRQSQRLCADQDTPRNANFCSGQTTVEAVATRSGYRFFQEPHGTMGTLAADLGCWDTRPFDERVPVRFPCRGGSRRTFTRSVAPQRRTGWQWAGCARWHQAALPSRIVLGWRCETMRARWRRDRWDGTARIWNSGSTSDDEWPDKSPTKIRISKF